MQKSVAPRPLIGMTAMSGVCSYTGQGFRSEAAADSVMKTSGTPATELMERCAHFIGGAGRIGSGTDGLEGQNISPPQRQPG